MRERARDSDVFDSYDNIVNDKETDVGIILDVFYSILGDKKIGNNVIGRDYSPILIFNIEQTPVWIC